VKKKIKVEGEHDLRETLTMLVLSSNKIFFDLSLLKLPNEK